MGAAQSTDTVGNDSGEVLFGFQVLRVDSNSPAEVAKLSPFFDYIVSVNGVIVVNICFSFEQSCVSDPRNTQCCG